MAVTVTSTISGPYYPNGVTRVFAFDFKAASASEVEVHQGEVGSWVPISDAAYTASVDPDLEGGSVEFSVAPAAGTGKIYIVSAPTFTREGQYTGEGPFTPKGLNSQLDRAAVRDLVLARDLERGVKVPLGESAGTLPALADRAGKLALFTEDGGMVGIDTLLVGNPDFQDDGLWNEASDLIDDGNWG